MNQIKTEADYLQACIEVRQAHAGLRDTLSDMLQTSCDSLYLYKNVFYVVLHELGLSKDRLFDKTPPKSPHMKKLAKAFSDVATPLIDEARELSTLMYKQKCDVDIYPDNKGMGLYGHSARGRALPENIEEVTAAYKELAGSYREKQAAWVQRWVGMISDFKAATAGLPVSFAEFQPYSNESYQKSSEEVTRLKRVHFERAYAMAA